MHVCVCVCTSVSVFVCSCVCVCVCFFFFYEYYYYFVCVCARVCVCVLCECVCGSNTLEWSVPWGAVRNRLDNLPGAHTYRGWCPVVKWGWGHQELSGSLHGKASGVTFSLHAVRNSKELKQIF